MAFTESISFRGHDFHLMHSILCFIDSDIVNLLDWSEGYNNFRISVSVVIYCSCVILVGRITKY